jgi:hypothetical protein
MRPFNLLIGSLLAFICCSTAEKSSVSKWKLVWSDDFSYTGLPDSQNGTMMLVVTAGVIRNFSFIQNNDQKMQEWKKVI